MRREDNSFKNALLTNVNTIRAAKAIFIRVYTLYI